MVMQDFDEKYLDKTEVVLASEVKSWLCIISASPLKASINIPICQHRTESWEDHLFIC